MIRSIELCKKFGNKEVVKNVNLNVKRGEIYGFLGASGAGKTTVIKMLTGILPKTSGKIGILGMDLIGNEIEIKRRIGIVPEEPKIYSYFTGNEFIDFILDVYRLDKNNTLTYFEELCDAFNIDFLNTLIGDMSHGMRQKMMLSSVLMRKPEVLFLDEPTVGLDAKSAKIFKELIQNISKDGGTVFMTTHVLEIAQKLCGRIGILDKGELIAEGTVNELRNISNKHDASAVDSLEDIFLKLIDQDENVKSIVKELS